MRLEAEHLTKLKINHWRSSPGPPELAGFYVDSVWGICCSGVYGVLQAGSLLVV